MRSHSSKPPTSDRPPRSKNNSYSQKYKINRACLKTRGEMQKYYFVEQSHSFPRCWGRTNSPQKNENNSPGTYLVLFFYQGGMTSTLEQPMCSTRGSLSLTTCCPTLIFTDCCCDVCPQVGVSQKVFLEKWFLSFLENGFLS